MGPRKARGAMTGSSAIRLFIVGDRRIAFANSPCCLLTVVPDIGRELPVISDLFPNHNILPGYFLRRRALALQAEGPDLACRGGAERFDVNGCEFRIANLFRHAFP